MSSILPSLSASPASSHLLSATLDTPSSSPSSGLLPGTPTTEGLITPPNSPQPKPHTITPMDNNMPEEKPTLFWGDIGYAGEDPQDFINSIELRFIGKANATDTDRIATLKLSLKTGSDAHAWFKGLDNTTRSTWAGLKAAFDLRWLERVIAAKTTEEKTSTLMAAELKSEDVGKKVTINRVEEWSHIAWADRVERLTGAILNSEGLLINQVCKKLLYAMHDLLGSHSSWTAFCQAVQDLPIERI
ncbi:hypothetical protein H0H87_002330 [Tephrocybe sp. NHM501043]|nr:hypothetical protein H0H87_002330 [Tephrocybe sp. NHM501043]